MEVPVPGQPKLRALAAAIEEAGGDDVIFDQVADGTYLTRIAEEWDVSSQLLRKWVRLDPERERRYEAAKRASADALVEDAGSVLDRASVASSAHVQKAKSQAEFKRWLASKRDRQQYGDDAAQVSVNLNLGELHLDALRQRARVVEIPATDVEILDGPAPPPEHSLGPGVRHDPSVGE